MAKRKNNDHGAHSRAEAAGDERPVYFDTSLDTHILLTVSDYDTVSDLTKKIVLEHLKCFPTFGPIKIHAFKVKRRGYFYHLSESMLVRCAFEGVMKRWFLSVDASSLNGENEKGLGTEFVSEEQPKVPASTGIDTNGITSTTSNGKSIPFEVGATIGSKEMNHTKKQQSRDRGILASPAFQDSSNAVKRGTEIGSEDKDPSNDKTKKRKLPINNAISNQDDSDRQNNEVIVKDSKNYSTHDERPRKRSKKSVAANPNLSSTEDEIAIAEVHNTGEKKEKLDPSHQNDTNGYVKEATSSAEFLGINKGKESEKSNNGKRMNKSTKKSVVVKEDALSMEKDCRLENKTDEKIEVPNEKDHEIMLSEEVDPKLHIEKTVTTFNSEANKVKEVENTTSEQRKKMKAKNKVVIEKNVIPSYDVPANDLTYKSDDEAMLSERGDDSIRKEAESFLVNQVIEASQENSKSMKSDLKNQLAGRVLKEAGLTHSNLKQKKQKKKKKKTDFSRVLQPTDIVP